MSHRRSRDPADPGLNRDQAVDVMSLDEGTEMN